MKKYEYDEVSGDFTLKKSKEQVENKQEQPQIKPAYPPSKPNTSTSQGCVWGIIIAICVGCGIFIKSMSSQKPGDLTNRTQPLSTYDNSVYTNEVVVQVDQNRVKRLISNICKNSSKGGNYEMLGSYFEDTIFPHPSGRKRYRSNISNTTRDFVEYYPRYNISEPYNFIFLHNTFPLTVKCDVDVIWVSRENGTTKKASIHKTYYITSNYKVSGFVDDEFFRTTLNY